MIRDHFPAWIVEAWHKDECLAWATSRQGDGLHWRVVIENEDGSKARLNLYGKSSVHELFKTLLENRKKGQD